MAMELYQIRHFVAIVENRGFTKAAARAGVSQPALSASIAKLEEEFGVKLLHRTPKTILPTEAGRKLLSTGRDILGSCNRIKAELRSAADDRPMRIGVLRTLPSAHLTHLLATLQSAWPGTTIELLDGSRETLGTQLSRGKVLACITISGEEREGVKSVELLREGYCLVVGRGHRFAGSDGITLDQLHGERFIVRTHCETFDSTTQALTDRGIKTHIVFKTDQDDRALALIGAGLGVALMPALFDGDLVKKVQVRDFHTQRIISLEWKADTVDERISNLISCIKGHNWDASATASIAAAE